MRGDNAIVIKNLSKVFLKKEGLDRISFWQKIFKTNKSSNFFALKDINLEIKQGEIIGIIGPNGAGKSTLLKILAEVTPPSKGEVEIYGKLASILEIGIGFQPELSGYENIFLVGQLYGLRKKEIAKKIEKIIELFGFPNFINTEVKYYSSGMYMRLAFSIIINIEADIYLFDEILNVGDAAFQWQALAEIKKLKEKGKTVLIVTHVPANILSITDKFVLLNKGILKSFNSPDKTILEYSNLNKNKSDIINEKEFTFDENYLKRKKNINDTFNLNIIELIIYNEFNYDNKKILNNYPIVFSIKIKKNYNKKMNVNILFKDISETVFANIKIPLTIYNEKELVNLKIEIPENTFTPNNYLIDILVLNEKLEILTGYQNLFLLEVQSDVQFNTIGYVNLPFKGEIV